MARHLYDSPPYAINPSRTSNTDKQMGSWWRLGPPFQLRSLALDKLAPMSVAIRERSCVARSLPGLRNARLWLGKFQPSFPLLVIIIPVVATTLASK